MARRQSKEQNASRSPGFGGWPVVVVALFLARFWTPAEGTVQGTTLWIAATWLAVGAVRAWRLWKEGANSRLIWHAADLALGAMVLGHCLSAAAVLVYGGDQRAALNVTWEWISLVPLVLLLKEVVQEGRGRRLLTTGLLISVGVLAVMGIWQHFVWYPNQSRNISELLALQAKVETRIRLSAQDDQRYQELVRLIGPDLLTLDESARMMLLNRAQNSLEPIGCFALANTLAALLATGLFGCFGVGMRARGAGWRTVSLIAALGIAVAVCLILTKSRTAWAGVFLACGWLAAASIARRRTLSVSLQRWGLIGLIVGLACVGIWGLGGLDREVITEAPKSLEYRLEYWRGTLAMLGDNFWLGAGPGNFRQHYQQYKLPGSSEEILDPHNLFLDAWSNGGLLALGGVLWLSLWWLWRALQFQDLQDDRTTTAIPPLPWVIGTGGLSLAFVFAKGWLFDGVFHDELLALAVGWVALAGLAGNTLSRFSPAVLYWIAAGVALGIHLLGAGGIGMPAVLQVWLALSMLSATEAAKLATGRLNVTPAWQLGGAVTSGLLLIACLMTSLVPVLTRDVLMERARYAAVQGNLQSAAAALSEAVKADPLSPEPLEELAMTYHAQWSRAKQDNDLAFEKAVETLRQAISLDPAAAKRWLRLGEWRFDRFRQTGRREEAQLAIEALREAARLYPSFSLIRARLAQALHATGSDAVEEARAALRIDDLNRSKGHVDKILPDRIREELERIER